MASTLVHEQKGLMPQPVRNMFNGLNHLTEAFEIGCRGVRDTTAGIDEITSLMLKQQKERLKLEFNQA